MSDIDRDRELEGRLAGAPREAQPGRDLWPAVAQAIAAGSASAAMGPGRRLVPRLPLQIAAALALFAGGVLVGQRWGEPAPESTEAPVERAEYPLAAAAEVQRAGTEYVTALSRLREASGPLERAQGADAAMSAFQGAAYELVRLRPDDPIAARILYTVSEAQTDAGEPTVRF
jgi:hypothetical protein